MGAPYGPGRPAALTPASMGIAARGGSQQRSMFFMVSWVAAALATRYQSRTVLGIWRAVLAGSDGHRASPRDTMRALQRSPGPLGLPPHDPRGAAKEPLRSWTHPDPVCIDWSRRSGPLRACSGHRELPGKRSSPRLEEPKGLRKSVTATVAGGAEVNGPDRRLTRRLASITPRSAPSPRNPGEQAVALLLPCRAPCCVDPCSPV